jgi:flavin reductase (DIM6/NTAB) family NADH-FMN oxidoreductase RutF
MDIKTGAFLFARLVISAILYYCCIRLHSEHGLAVKQLCKSANVERGVESMGFMETKPELLDDNPFKLIGSDWMLITAGTVELFNTMTASWGGLGILWERKVATCYIRPTRYTFEFTERSPYFTLSFFNEKHRKKLTYCGTHSGRNTDKVREAGLTPVKEGGFVYFEEARLVLACRKLYYQDINPDRFLDPKIENMYPQKDYHRMYIGEIVKCLVQGT